MFKAMMKTCFMAVAMIFLGIGLSAAEVHINGNFQPSARQNYAPRDWAVNTYGKKLQDLQFRFEYSEPDEQGRRTLSVTAPSDVTDFAIYGANAFIIPVSAGDKLVFSGEAKGSGTFRAGYYGYKTLSQGGSLGTVNLGQEFSPFSFEFMIKDGSGDNTAYIRPALYFGKGAEVDIRHLKLDIEHTDPVAVARRGFRYYPVYKLSAPLSMDIEKDMALWQNIPEARGFAIHKTAGQWQDEDQQTSFRMAHDGEKLYLLVTCEDPLTDQIQFDPTQIHKAAASLEFGISSIRGPYGTPHAWRKADTLGKVRTSGTQQTGAGFPVVVQKSTHTGAWQYP